MGIFSKHVIFELLNEPLLYCVETLFCILPDPHHQKRRLLSRVYTILPSGFFSVKFCPQEILSRPFIH